MENLFLTFDIVEGQLFTQDESIRKRMFQLVGQSYVNPAQLINRIYAVNDIAFVARINTEIVGVLLFNYQDRCSITVGNQTFLAIYNGYAVTDLQYRNQRIIQKLVAFATEEFNQRIQLLNSRLLLYAITSNPYALRAYRTVCDYMEPFADGSYTEYGSHLVTQLKSELGISVFEDAHPFKFTTSLPQRYSLFEQVNLDKAPEAEKLFLQKLGVHEVQGDRVIFFWGPQDLFSACSIEKPSDGVFHLGPSEAADTID
ncbi:hypothetical protein [Spirosoma aerophilum]